MGASIKLIAIDMDDTLLNDRQQVTERTRRAIRQALDMGVQVAIATGRMFRSALPFAMELGIRLPLITYNGAMIRELDSGKTLFHRPIEPELACELADLFHQKGWYLQKYVDDVLYVPNWMITPGFMPTTPEWKRFPWGGNSIRCRRRRPRC